MSKPNLIIFVPDQMRADSMGHMGNKHSVTPNLDNLIKEDAVSFKNAFVQNPTCTPSRCSFMTGWYPHIRGHRSMTSLLEKDEPMLLRALMKAGYHVWWGGKNDLVAGEEGYENSCNTFFQAKSKHKSLIPTAKQWRKGQEGTSSYYSWYYGKQELLEGEEVVEDSEEMIIRGAVDFIKNRPADQPFCIYMPIGSPHPPYSAPEPFYSSINRDAIDDIKPPYENWDDKPQILRLISEKQNMQGYTQEQWKELKATYLASVSRVDDHAGRLVEALKAEGVYDDTALFFLSDHGDFTGDYGLVEKTENTFQDCLVNVPLVVKPPANYPVKAGVDENLVELIDIVPTIYEYAGMEFDYTQFGKSLNPVLAGGVTDHRDAVFCEGGRKEDEDHASENYIKPFTPDGLFWPRKSNDNRSNGKAIMIRTADYKYVHRLYDPDELYDLKKDPNEYMNEINNPEYKEILLDMKEKMLNWHLECGDVVKHTINSRRF